jgi:hypothetical protein
MITATSGAFPKMFKPAKCLLLLGLVVSATAITAFAMQPVAPLRFMEERHWRVATGAERWTPPGPTTYVIVGKWSEILRDADAELRRLGLQQQMRMCSLDQTRSYAKDNDFLILSDVELSPAASTTFEEGGAEPPIKVFVEVSSRLHPRSRWDQLLALFGAE